MTLDAGGPVYADEPMDDIKDNGKPRFLCILLGQPENFDEIPAMQAACGFRSCRSATAVLLGER
jgi:hypothetical protein